MLANYDKSEAENGIQMSELITKMKYASSKSESRKLIRGKGVRLNGQIVENELLTLDYKQISQNENIIRVGKKKYFKIIIE